MKALNLAIYTGNEDGHKVTMSAQFDNHDEAVRFHEGVAKLCKDVSPETTRYQHPMLKLLGR